MQKEDEITQGEFDVVANDMESVMNEAAPVDPKVSSGSGTVRTTAPIKKEPAGPRPAKKRNTGNAIEDGDDRKPGQTPKDEFEAARALGRQLVNRMQAELDKFSFIAKRLNKREGWGPMAVKELREKAEVQLKASGLERNDRRCLGYV